MLINDKMRDFVVLFVFVLSLVAHSQQLRQVEQDGNRLLEANQNNYALSGTEITSQLGWKCASVNGQNVTHWRGDGCESDTKLLHELGGAAVTLVRIKDKLGGHFKSIGTSINSDIIFGDNVRNMNLNIGQSGPSWITNNRDGIESFLYSMDNSAVSVSGDLVAFVHRDNQVQMKPIACLDATEKELLAKIRSDLKEHQRMLEERRARREREREQRQVERDQRERERDQRQVQREREREQRQVQREQERLAREAERERAKEAREAEREQRRLEKEARKEQERLEKEARKEQQRLEKERRKSG